MRERKGINLTSIKIIVLIIPLLIYSFIILRVFADDHSNVCIHNVIISKEDDKEDDCDDTVIIMIMIRII